MNNPEFRQTLHNISHNLETANQAAQENIYTLTQFYIDPCLEGLRACVYECTAPCFPTREVSLRRKRGRSRGRAEYNFDFYNAWDDDEALGDSSISWGTDELDSLLAGGAPQISPAEKAAGHELWLERATEADSITARCRSRSYDYTELIVPRIPRTTTMEVWRQNIALQTLSGGSTREPREHSNTRR